MERGDEGERFEEIMDKSSGLTKKRGYFKGTWTKRGRPHFKGRVGRAVTLDKAMSSVF